MLSRQHPPQQRTLSTIPASELTMFYQMPLENRRHIYLRITGGGGFEYGTGRERFGCSVRGLIVSSIPAG